MSFYKMLMSGHKIRIEDKGHEYAPTEFWSENGKIFSMSPALGIMKRSDITPAHFNRHIANMVDENFTVSIFPV